MATRFIYATDFHYTTTPPAGRVDDYGEAIRRKLEEVVALAGKAKAKLLFGGDMFHKKPGGVTMAEVQDLIRILKPGAPIYGILGNHDLAGHQARSVASSAIGVLVEAGILVLVDEPKVVDGVTIAGYSYHPDYEQPESYGVDFNPCDCVGKVAGVENAYTPTIWLSHGILVDDGKDYPYQVTRAKDVANDDCSIRLLINGHAHTPWDGEARHSGEVMLNPGSVGRVARNEVHDPSVVGISVADDGTIRHKVVKLKSAAAAEEIFGEQEQATKTDDDGIEVFANALRAESGDLGQGELLAAVERACGDDKELRLKVGGRLGI
jgi:exonuclease SbcD